MLYSSISPDWEPLGLKPVKWKNAAEELAFHAPPNTSSVVSKPGTSAVRGGKKDMYYDEAAHIREFPKLWQAGIPAITRDAGRVTVVSTPLGQSGLYYELWNTDRWSHHKVPWWHSRFMVRGGTYDDVAEAMYKIEKDDMGTEERLEAFGSEKIKDIFEIAMMRDIVQFKTEYECEFVDETDAFYPYDLLMENKTLGRPWKTWHDSYESEGYLTIGVDLATQRDATVITVVEHANDHKKLLYFLELHDKYEQQFETLKNLVKSVKPSRISIDATGPGQMFSQKASAGQLETSANIEAVNFNNEKKEKWATTFKGELQTSKVSYPDHPKFIAQTHGIKRTRTETQRFKFSGDKHDDYFWSAMLACYGEGRAPIRFHRV